MSTLKINIEWLQLLKNIIEGDNKDFLVTNIDNTNNGISTILISSKENKEIISYDYLTKIGFVYDDFMPLISLLISYGLNELNK